jgi:hypothetical protein
MAPSAAPPLGLGILWRDFDRCRALPEGIESASGASSSAFCFPWGKSERLNKHFRSEKRGDQSVTAGDLARDAHQELAEIFPAQEADEGPWSVL